MYDDQFLRVYKHYQYNRITEDEVGEALDKKFVQNRSQILKGTYLWRPIRVGGRIILIWILGGDKINLKLSTEYTVNTVMNVEVFMAIRMLMLVIIPCVLVDTLRTLRRSIRPPSSGQQAVSPFDALGSIHKSTRRYNLNQRHNNEPSRSMKDDKLPWVPEQLSASYEESGLRSYLVISHTVKCPKWKLQAAKSSVLRVIYQYFDTIPSDFDEKGASLG